ncbi:MAG: hypothetical protein JNK47_16080 [Mesorhizobium sp.]|nr:hypothetical protein [Mesorhizobium sp.]MBL8578742.1 hypothetical protein [Mesorhizobium sp.]
MAESWWTDGCRGWCAYCGRKMRTRKGPSNAKTCSTKDHLIPKAEGGVVTIPCCRECNLAKGRLSIAEFIESSYFLAVRVVTRPQQWSMTKLFNALELAVVKRRHPKATSGMNRPADIPVLRLPEKPIPSPPRFRRDLFHT